MQKQLPVAILEEVCLEINRDLPLNLPSKLFGFENADVVRTRCGGCRRRPPRYRASDSSTEKDKAGRIALTSMRWTAAVSRCW